MKERLPIDFLEIPVKMKMVMNMKYVSFLKFLKHAKIEYNTVRYEKQPAYRKLKWDQYKNYYHVFLIGHNYQGEYDKLEAELKDVEGSLL